VTLRDRDKKLIAAIVPAVLILAYWFVALAPKRHEASDAGSALTEARQKRDDAAARAGELTQAKLNYATDYETVVRLGKAIPASVDMPSLLLQLDRAARGTGIDFTKIQAGARQTAAGTGSASGGAGAPASGGPPAPAGGASSGASSSASPGTGTPPAAAGGQTAQSGPGKAAEAAGNAQNTANSASNAAAGSSSETDTTTSQNVSKGKGLPIGGGDASGATAGSGGSGVPGLDTVPLDFEFQGSFFDLADFFHRMKRFVHVVNDRILVRGRLMTIDTVSFKSGDQFPRLTADFHATVYLSPKDEGVTVGATPDGPAGARPAGGSTGAPSSSQPAAQAPPTAAVTR
jgi:hypothetical protein